MPGLSGRSERQAGEARRSSDLDEAEPPPRNGNDTGAGLLEAAVRRENLLQAWKQVRANKGAAGADGLDINQTAAICASLGLPSATACRKGRIGRSRCVA